MASWFVSHIQDMQMIMFTNHLSMIRFMAVFSITMFVVFIGKVDG